MAKNVGLIGSVSGKVGNVVYSVTNGIQSVRAYQPIITNPKSSLQMSQRSRANLAGRISSFVPRTAIMGLGDNNRTRRGAFLRQLLKFSTVTVANNEYRAKIADEDVLFSVGPETFSVGFRSASADSNSIVVTLAGYPSTVIPADSYASKQTRLVVMVYDLTTNDLVEVVTRIANKPTQSTDLTTILPIVHNGGYTAVVYAIPMSTSDGSAMSVTTDMVDKSDADILALLTVNKNARSFVYGRSVMFGQTTYTPA